MIALNLTSAPSSAASGLLSGRAHYLHWGVIQISLTNFLIIVAMVVLFLLALVVPFPQSRPARRDEEGSDAQR
jgi:large-conductance mechanosensitive channel